MRVSDKKCTILCKATEKETDSNQKLPKKMQMEAITIHIQTLNEHLQTHQRKWKKTQPNMQCRMNKNQSAEDQNIHIHNPNKQTINCHFLILKHLINAITTLLPYRHQDFWMEPQFTSHFKRLILRLFCDFVMAPNVSRFAFTKSYHGQKVEYIW